MTKRSPSIFGISVIVCTYNGAERLCKTLEHIFNQKVKDVLEWEVIVVDNNSTDKTLKIVESIFETQKCYFNCQAIVERKQGKNYAALTGLRNARYPWVLICDDDNHLDSDYLQVGMNILQSQPGIGALGGCGRAVFEGSKPEWFSTYAHSFAVNPQSSHNGKIKKRPAALYGAGTFFRKQALVLFFEKGFNGIMSCRSGELLTSGGDVEWCYLIQLAGYEIWYSSQLGFDHYMPASRLQWSYYLRLKKGIASGVGNLLSYQPFFYTKNPSIFFFLRIYINRLLKSIFVLSVFFFRKTFVRQYYSDEEKELGNAILPMQIKSYLSSYKKSYRHFKQLKQIVSTFK